MKSSEDFNTLREYDQYKIKQLNKKKHKQNKIKPVKHKPNKLTKLQKNYKKYLLSDEWNTIKIEMRKFYNNQCQICSNEYNLHVHHKTYKNFGNEEPEDLMLVCKKCHKELHKHKKRQLI